MTSKIQNNSKYATTKITLNNKTGLNTVKKPIKKDPEESSIISEASNLSSEKIRSFIYLLEDHMDKCEKEERFEEAAVARDRIIKLKKIENMRNMKDLQIKLENEYNQLDQKFNIEKEALLNKKNESIEGLKNKFKELLQDTLVKHDNERETAIKEFNEKYPPQPKFSPEVLNLQKIMEGHIKKQEYENANEVKLKILALCEAQDKKHNSDSREAKKDSELQKLKSKQDIEISALKQKEFATEKELERKFDKEYEALHYKHVNNLKDLSIVNSNKISEQERLNKRNINSKLTANSNFLILGQLQPKESIIVSQQNQPNEVIENEGNDVIEKESEENNQNKIEEKPKDNEKEDEEENEEDEEKEKTEVKPKVEEKKKDDDEEEDEEEEDEDEDKKKPEPKVEPKKEVKKADDDDEEEEDEDEEEED